MGGGFIGLPPIVDCDYDRAGTPGHACNGCNSAWPADEGVDDPLHHATTCPWWTELCARGGVDLATGGAFIPGNAAEGFHHPGCGWEGDDSSVWTCVDGCGAK